MRHAAKRVRATSRQLTNWLRMRPRTWASILPVLLASLLSCSCVSQTGAPPKPSVPLFGFMPPTLSPGESNQTGAMIAVFRPTAETMRSFQSNGMVVGDIWVERKIIAVHNGNSSRWEFENDSVVLCIKASKDRSTSCLPRSIDEIDDDIGWSPGISERKIDKHVLIRENERFVGFFIDFNECPQAFLGQLILPGQRAVLVDIQSDKVMPK